MIRSTLIRSARTLTLRRQSSSSTKGSSWPQRFGKWTAGQAIVGLIGSGSIVGGAVSLYTWYYPSPHVKHMLNRKIKAVEDCLVNNEKHASPASTGIPKIDRADFAKTLLAMSVESVINIEGPPGTGKSSFITEMLEVENKKGTPVAHLELRGRDLNNIPAGCSVSNYICYPLGLESAVDSGKIVMDIAESSEYVEMALRKMKADGKQTPILVVDDVQTLFDADAVDVVSSLKFMALLVQWHTEGLIRPVLICSQGSITKYFERVSGMPIRTETFRLPEITDEDLFNHLKLKANPLRVNNNWVPWTDEEIAYMIHVYGANLKSINNLFAYPDSPTSRVNAHLESKRNHLATVVSVNQGTEALIKEILKKGCIGGDSMTVDRDALGVLIDANILAMINRKYMFHSRIVERAAEAIFGFNEK
jgi:hypothetical protein